MEDNMKTQYDMKLPPNDMEAEESVLGAILMGGFETYDKVSEIIQDDEAFYDHLARHTFRGMGRLRKREQVIEPITLINEVKKKNNGVTAYYITGLLDRVPGPSMAGQHARMVWEKFVQRQVGRTAYKLYNASFSNIDTTRQILEEHGRYVDVLRALLPSRNGDIGTIIQETVDKIIKGDAMIPFNFKPLDDFSGGMTRGEITVLGGRPGHGKTTLVVNLIGKLISAGKKVLLLNREMSNTEMMRKLLVMESKDITYDEVRRNKVSKKVEEKLVNGLTTIISDKYSNLTMYDDIRSLEESMAEVTKFKPDVVIDDYIQLVAVSGAVERRFQLERVMNDYKWICKKENCSAILVSQLNREIERRFDPKPKLSDFAESGVIEQCAESALFVYYPYQYDDEKFSPYSINVIAAKSRYGLTGESTLGFNGNKCRFFNTESEALLEPNK
jgi:replicative DNA helicase|tara:strand:- start:771 stop:2102 length:1332 start_codon:yes stop_codon:yes gene_type:complete